MMDLVGQTLGQYRIEAPLGAGGMGQVFRGRHVLIDRPAAIKVMLANFAANPDFRARFLQEAKSAAALQHPNIVATYDFGEQDGQLYLVMELMADGSLRSLLRRRATAQPWPLALGIDLIRQAALGLAAAQALGMIHRDIKPDNLLLNRLLTSQPGVEQYVLKISDFGLARMAESSGLTTMGGPIGTLAYMSPEQCQGKKLDGRTDIYALGITLYEVATGYLPFQINNFSEALDKHMNAAPPPPRQMRPDLPPGLEEIILRCLAKKPEERYATGTELAEALQRVLNNADPVTIQPVNLPAQEPVHTRGTALQMPVVGNTSPPAFSVAPGTTGTPRVRVLDQAGHTRQVVEITGRGITVGRQPGNDIVLQTPEVSRQHLRVQWDGRQVLVTDLGSSNGTVLGNLRLTPQVGQPWTDQQPLHLGPFWLRLEGSSAADDLSLLVPPPSIAHDQTTYRRTPVNVHSLGGGSRFNIAVEPENLTITPGQLTAVQVKLTNVGNIVDWLTVTVEGVPPDWVQGPGREIQLNPTMQETTQLNVQVARTPNNYANDYPVLIRARSREKRDESVTAQGRWTVLPFRDDALRLEPRRASGQGKATYAVTLSNGGNALEHYALSGDDDEQKLNYHFERSEVDLPPGREVRVPLTVGDTRHWLGREQRKPFLIHSRPRGSSSPLSATGEFVNRAVLPAWLLPVALVVLAASVGLASLFGLLPLPGGHPALTPTPIVARTPGFGQTPTPITTPAPTLTVAPSPTQAPSPTVMPSPSPTLSPTPVPIRITANSVTTVAPGLNGGVGSWYVASQDRLYFVEYNGNLSMLSNASSSSPTYQVLGTGYTEPEDIVVTADGSTAYITERVGNLLRVALSNPNRSAAIAIVSGLNAPHQIALDEAHNVVYLVEFAVPGRLLRIDLNTNSTTVLLGALQHAIGLLISPDFNTAYITEQLDNGTGQLSRYNLTTANGTVLATSTTSPLFFLSWANSSMNAILVPERSSANKVWYVDLTQPSVTLQQVAAVASGPASVSRLSSSNLFPLLVSTGGEIDALS